MKVLKVRNLWKKTGNYEYWNLRFYRKTNALLPYQNSSLGKTSILITVVLASLYTLEKLCLACCYGPCYINIYLSVSWERQSIVWAEPEILKTWAAPYNSITQKSPCLRWSAFSHTTICAVVCACVISERECKSTLLFQCFIRLPLGEPLGLQPVLSSFCVSFTIWVLC